MQRIRDLALLEDRIELRVSCLRLEQLAWLDPHVRLTRRMTESVAQLCVVVTSVRHAARWHGFDWKTAKAIDFRTLKRTLGPVDQSEC